MTLDTKRDVHMSTTQLQRWGAAAKRAKLSRAAWVRRACDERAELEEQGGAVVVVQLPDELRIWLDEQAAAEYRDPPSMVLAILARASRSRG